MIFNLKIVRVHSDYCDYLRKFDHRVAYNRFDNAERPFIGILFIVNDFEYFAPLSSPKPKHKTMKNMIDFFKIKDGEYGVVNFNNMIPVTKEDYELIDLTNTLLNIQELKYQHMLRQQLDWLNANIHQVKNKSFKLYSLYINKKLPKNVIDRCCNFPLLEEKCMDYIKKKKKDLVYKN